jgi:hypothetical protein
MLVLRFTAFDPTRTSVHWAAGDCVTCYRKVCPPSTTKFVPLM